MRPIDADELRKKAVPHYYANCIYAVPISVIDEQPTIEQPKWIPAAERLPEKEERVLVWNGKGLVQLCRYQYRYDIKKKRLREAFFTVGNTMPYQAKYWMPLPQPPKENE